MALTDTALRAVKSGEKAIKLFDGDGLFLFVTPSGTKSWRLKYHFQNKEKLIVLGQYPLLSLKEARQRAMDARKSIANGKDPSAERKQAKVLLQNTFEMVAMEWHQKQSPAWSSNYAETNMYRMRRNLFPHVGSRPIADITAPELLTVLRKIEARGTFEVAHCVRNLCSGIFRYAIATGRAERDPAADLRGALSARVRKNRAAVTAPEAVGALMNALDNYPGTLVVRSALQLTALTFCRSGEIRRAEWKEFDLPGRLWRIPADKMKMSRDHLVQLSSQAMAILERLHRYSGNDQFVFPSYNTEKKSMGKETMLGAIRRMGFEKDEMCPHGFRAMASTLLNELGYNRDWIERQLAHVPREHIRGIYNRAEYLPERRKMMQAWADYLDELRLNAKQII
jgi:integrase